MGREQVGLSVEIKEGLWICCVTTRIWSRRIWAEAADGPIQIVQGRGDCGPCQEPMGSSYLYIIRDSLVFVLFKLGFVSLDIKSPDYKYVLIPNE